MWLRLEIDFLCRKFSKMEFGGVFKITQKNDKKFVASDREVTSKAVGKIALQMGLFCY